MKNFCIEWRNAYIEPAQKNQNLVWRLLIRWAGAGGAWRRPVWLQTASCRPSAAPPSAGTSWLWQRRPLTAFSSSGSPTDSWSSASPWTASSSRSKAWSSGSWCDPPPPWPCRAGAEPSCGSLLLGLPCRSWSRQMGYCGWPVFLREASFLLGSESSWGVQKWGFDEIGSHTSLNL